MKSIFPIGQSKNCSSLIKNRLSGFLFSFKNLSTLLLICLSFFSLQTFGQSANIDQVRNSLTYDNSTDPLWVNGNAGSSNSHYVEGHSIAYRTLLTGLVSGKTYSIVLGYDTKHSDRMAIDYLTHYQRLLPHGPFGHPAEVINPLRMESGSNEYNMIVGAPETRIFPVPDPAPAGAAGTPVANQPQNSFGNLPNAEKVMTLWNGSFIDMNYTVQETLTGTSAQAETQIRIKFTASSDSVLFAWGGHIASRLDWLFDANGIPLSAGGISGSPYHMRLKQLFVYNGTPVGTKTCTKDSCEVGLGNQDRSLSAAAVIPPPVCPTVSSQTKCLETTSFVFNIDLPDATTTYTWSIGSNTANAVFDGGGNIGNSVTIVPANPGGFTGGSFTLNITASKNGADLSCPAVATGTVIDVQVDAEDADNTLQINLNNSTTASLGIQSISPGTTADYDFLWKLVSQPVGGSSSFTNATSANATFNVLNPFAQGDYIVRVVATQKVAPFCKDSSDVTIVVSGGVNCNVKGPSPVCPGSQDNVYFYDEDNDGDEDPIPGDFDAVWSFDGLHPSASFDGTLTGSSVKVDVAALGSSCATSYTVKLTLTSKTGSTQTSCTKTVSVEDTEAPVITVCPTDKNLECGASTDPADTGEPTFTDNCSASASKSDATVSNCNTTVITRTWTVTDLCGNTATCVQLIVIKDTEAPEITCLSDGNITVTDNCSAPADIITYYKDVSGVRKWTAVDASGNTSNKDCDLPAALQARSTNNAVSEAIQQNVEETVAQSKVSPKKVAINAPALQVKAFPNPFTNNVTFRFSSPESGRAILEVFNTLGQKLGVVYEGRVKAGVVQDIHYDVKKASKGTLIYKLSVNNKTVNGKLNQLK